MADTTSGAGGRSSRPARQLRAGLVPSTHLLTTRGGNSGQQDLVAEADRHPVVELLALDRLASDHG